MLSDNVINSGIATFEMEYELWVVEQRKKDDKLRKVLLTHTSDIELQIFVDNGLNHHYELFRMKADATKAGVFYLMNGLWRTPVERFFQWIGGFRPSELLCMLMPQLELTDTQLMKADHHRWQILQQMCQILTLIQAANALLVLGEYFQRLRVLSSIWSDRPRNPTTLLS